MGSTQASGLRHRTPDDPSYRGKGSGSGRHCSATRPDDHCYSGRARRQAMRHDRCSGYVGDWARGVKAMNLRQLLFQT